MFPKALSNILPISIDIEANIPIKTHTKQDYEAVLLEDLEIKKKENSKDFSKLIDAINRVWNCEEPDSVLDDLKSVEFKKGLPVGMLLKILKWLFIEQDITYWNYDGRGMLRDAINKHI